MRSEFGSAGASWRALGLKTAGAHRTMYVEASKSAGAKGDVPNTYLRVRAPAAPVLTHSLTKVVLRFEGPN